MSGYYTPSQGTTLYIDLRAYFIQIIQRNEMSWLNSGTLILISSAFALEVGLLGLSSFGCKFYTLILTLCYYSSRKIIKTCCKNSSY